MAKKTKDVPTVRPCDRAPGKFEGVYADGTVHPYAFRTQEEALAAVGGNVPQADDAEIETKE